MAFSGNPAMNDFAKDLAVALDVGSAVTGLLARCYGQNGRME